MVEQRTENPCVPGSIPGGTTERGEDVSFPLFYFNVMAHFVYIIYSQSIDKFYVGETVNIAERLTQHNSGFYNGAFSKQATDWRLFWSVECNSGNQALKLEKFIKKMKNRNFYFRLKENPKIADDIFKNLSE